VRTGDQENLPTEQSAPQSQTRISRAHEIALGSRDPQAPSRQGPRAPVGLSDLSHVAPLISVRRRSDFERARREGTRVRSPALTLYVRQRGENGGPSRLGLTVGSSCGGAVVRNRIKRRLRAAFVAADVGPGRDVIARGTPATARVSFQELVATMRDAAPRERPGPPA
jgi:ribonuclease P protein component